MRTGLTLLRNVLVTAFVLFRNLFKVLGLRPKAPHWVEFDITGDPPYRRPPWRLRLMAEVYGRRLPLDLETLKARFDRLSSSRHTTGVVLRLEGLDSSLSKIQAIAKMVSTLREAGKRVVAWAPSAGSREVPLLAACSGLYLSPSGRLDMRGFALESLSAAPALSRLGVDVTVVRRGNYKTAADPLVREEMSSEQRETLDAILDDLSNWLTDSLAKGRSLRPEEALQAIDEAPWFGDAAIVAGLVDGFCYHDELEERLSRKATLSSEPAEDEERRSDEGTGRARIGRWSDFQSSHLAPIGWRPARHSREAIAVVPLRGIIVEGESRQVFRDRSVGHRSFARALETARNASWAKAVVLFIDSRGGSALASDLMWREVERTAREKPVVAYLDTVAASGGYYVAAAASSILSSSLCITGSIGVISIIADASRLFGRLGVRREVLERGRRAALGTSARPPTAEEVMALEKSTAGYYEAFLVSVAEGRVYTGRKALELSLVDEIGGFEDAIDKAVMLAGLKKRPTPRVVEIQHGQGGPFGGTSEEILSDATRRAGSALQLMMHGPRGSGAVVDSCGALGAFDLAFLEAVMQRPNEAWAILPYRLTC